MENGFFIVNNRINVADIQIVISSIQLGTSSENLSNNLLNGNLPFNSSILILLPNAFNPGVRYLRLVGNENSIYSKSDIQISQGLSIEFTANDMESGYYRIRNNIGNTHSNNDIVSIFYRPTGTINWIDLNTTINRGTGNIRVFFTDRNFIDQRYDFRAYARNMAIYQRNDILLDQGRTVDFEVSHVAPTNGTFEIRNRIVDDFNYNYGIRTVQIKRTTDSEYFTIARNTFIPHGTNRTMAFHHYPNARYDIRVEASSGPFFVWLIQRNVSLNQNGTSIEFNYSHR
jgi:hypothetical protein